MRTTAVTRRHVLVSLVVVAAMQLVYGPVAVAMEFGARRAVRRAAERRGEERDAVGWRFLMPIMDDNYLSGTGTYDYRLIDGQMDRRQREEHHDHSNFSNTMIVGVCIGAGLLLVTACLTRKACVEWCMSSTRRTRHRAFIERSNDGWRCEACYHTNESLQTSCVFCGSTVKAIKVTSSQRQSNSTSAPVATSQSEASARSVSGYLPMTSPRSAWAQGPEALLSRDATDRQLVARERHQWKRCVGKHYVRWVYIPFESLRKNETLHSTIVRTRDVEVWQKRHPQQARKPSGTPLSFDSFADSSGPQVSCLSPRAAFVRDESQTKSSAVHWCFAENVSMSSRPYSRSMMRVATLTFAEKAQWFYGYSLKLSHSLVDGFHTIRVERDKVLKESVDLFLAAPRATLHRRFRVDFVNEVGVDGGGILREWLHLVCSELFRGDSGLFALTSSAAHQGYWINRTATEKTAEQLQTYVFVGKLLGKILLEGLLLNVRLSIPLLKHILGVPVKLSDLYLLDETVHSSMMWILENDDTAALSLNFTIQGTELIPNGTDVSLHDGNKQLYVAKVVQYYLFDSVRVEMSKIMEGLRSVISDTMLHVFDFKELDLLLSGLPQIDVNDWRRHTETRFYEHSSHEFSLIDWFWEILESFTQDQRGRLLQYVTGSSGVPVEGFRGLTGMDGEIRLFTIQLGNDVSTMYTVLPHASTCLNRLDLPLYPSKADLEQSLSMVIEMDITGFSSR
ncbi:unnamed protein product [Hyaloperonospora brassicae]|uniref:HECT-type E3 ubiquitin transferase n=1 Tax=Hyaloperonospora brassicae TaxID=162125 RepID=A0AAV0T0H9_HYABA|nr:unnamed protein product [Hyaloperonospora brassicae]